MKLKIVFLGGVGEIGKNMTVFECGNDILIVDCGVSFPTSDMPGVDLVISDFSYLKEKKGKIRGVILTHGHEDHIGGIPFLLKELPDLNIYGTKLTLALLENKLIEHNLTKSCTLKTVDDNFNVKIGPYSVEFIHVCHSVAGSCSLAIRTPAGLVFMTGDFKIDFTPLSGSPTNLTRIAQIGTEGVLLLLAESTNVDREGFTMSESVVSKVLHRLFNEAAGRRLIIATFSSNVDRLQEIFTIAKHFRRKVTVSGRSMHNAVETAKRVGILKFDEEMYVDPSRIDKIPDSNLVILSTGSQGEPMSALTRMSSGEFPRIKIGANDTVIISASPIPGNERDINTVINNLFKLGAQVVYSALEEVHVSGHACREELKLIHSLLHPKYFIPVHGEYRHLKQHALMAEKLGMKPKHMLIPEIGDVVELEPGRMSLKGKVANGNVYIDGSGVGDVGSTILRDRVELSEGGVVIVSVAISGGAVAGITQIVARGCFYTGGDEGSATINELKALVADTLKQQDLKNVDIAALKNVLIKQLRSYFKKNFQRFPMIIPIVNLVK